MTGQTKQTKSIDGISRRPEARTEIGRGRAKGAWLSRRLLVLFLALAAFIAIAVSVFMLVTKNGNPTLSGADVESVKGAISKHYLLPKDEQPALATVTDKSKLSTPFLKDSENGDKLLVYQKNHLAILYRPSIDRIINVGPVSLDEPPPSLTNN